MKKIIYSWLIGGLVSFSCVAYAADFDFAFTKSSGRLVVVDSFDRVVGKGDVSLDDIHKLKTETERLGEYIKKMASEAEQRKKEITKNAETIKDLERTVKKLESTVKNLETTVKRLEQRK